MTELSASQGTVFFQRAGIAVNGENYGFNLDFLFTGDTEVIDNPYADGLGRFLVKTLIVDLYVNRCTRSRSPTWSVDESSNHLHLLLEFYLPIFKWPHILTTFQDVRFSVRSIIR